ncbi:phytanoyl-CoA dioxygenase family protein [Saltatorellus ferox]|uniref:phytanoyl-CoA dioxygenase family protein n=1 Tax=Saltatorellus ferox TaxID=2528018 RepID=UPI003AF3FA31
MESDGFAALEDLIAEPQRHALRRAFDSIRVGAGRRDGLELTPVRELATEVINDPRLAGFARAFAVRAILFDKTPEANWLVTWHQDTTIPVRARREVAGFTSWSEKDGVPSVRPPAGVLESMLTVRVELDGSSGTNGPLRVVPGSHRGGILIREEIESVRAVGREIECLVPAGGALLMRPLLLHASSRASSPGRRRVVHLEFASDALPGGLEWHAAIGRRAVP